MKVSILGAGSWGTALAIHLARSGHGVLLWGRDAEVAAAIARERRHPRRLPGIPIPEGVRTTSDLAEAFEHSETLLLSVPCAAMREVLDASPGPDSRARRFVSTAKGIEPGTLKRMTEIVLERYPSSSVAALSGPTFADGVARGDPSAAVIADRGESFARDLQQRFSNGELRLYSSSDVVGVELAGALKNVIAIAAGIGCAYALVIGLPLMRLSGLAAGIATFAVLEITHNIVRNWEKIGPGPLTLSTVPETTGLLQATIGAIAWTWSTATFRRRTCWSAPTASRACSTSVSRRRRDGCKRRATGSSKASSRTWRPRWR